jgi:hypothetical protein
VRDHALDLVHAVAQDGGRPKPARSAKPGWARPILATPFALASAAVSNIVFGIAGMKAGRPHWRW